MCGAGTSSAEGKKVGQLSTRNEIEPATALTRSESHWPVHEKEGGATHDTQRRVAAGEAFMKWSRLGPVLCAIRAM